MYIIIEALRKHNRSYFFHPSFPSLFKFMTFSLLLFLVMCMCMHMLKLGVAFRFFLKCFEYFVLISCCFPLFACCCCCWCKLFNLIRY